MGREYYLFALFIGGLICIIAVLFKLLFADVRRQRKLLDEKESKLLQTYQTVESIMDEFNDQIKAAMEDIKEYEERAAIRAAVLATQPPPDEMQDAAPVVQPPVPAPSPAPTPARQAKRAAAPQTDPNMIRAASEVLERAERMVKSPQPRSSSSAAKSSKGEVIQRFFDDASIEPSEEEQESLDKNSRREIILALAEEGKTDAQIAQELGITQNEVKLVKGLTGV